MDAIAGHLLPRGIDPNTAFGNGPLVFPIELVPSSHVKAKLGTCITMLILTWSVFSMRAWTRIVISKSWGWDDSTMLLALVIISAFGSSEFY
jgi:hypothetical protein